jgi:AcrR family transcriptional regulator
VESKTLLFSLAAGPAPPAVERRRDPRARLLMATAEALDAHGAAGMTVDHVLKRVRIGRNTFYQHFDDVHDALGGVREWALDVLFDALEARVSVARTPVEHLRALAEGWLEAVEAHPLLARTALSHVVGADPQHLGSRARERLRGCFARAARHAQRDGLASGAPSEAVLHALAGAFIGLGLAVADSRRPALPGGRTVLLDLVASAFR